MSRTYKRRYNNYQNNKFDGPWKKRNDYYPNNNNYYYGNNFYNNYNNSNYDYYYDNNNNYYNRYNGSQNQRYYYNPYYSYYPKYYYKEVEIDQEDEISKKFKEDLNELGFYIKEVKGDGNCLFRCVSEQMEDDENNYEAYREKCIKYMLENTNEFAPFLEEDEPIDKYIEKMSKNGEWGGNLEIHALSKALQVNFYIHIYDQPVYVINNWEKPVKNIRLTYHNGKHYNSLKEKVKENNENENDEKINDKGEKSTEVNKEEEKENKNLDNIEEGNNNNDTKDLMDKVKKLNI